MISVLESSFLMCLSLPPLTIQAPTKSQEVQDEALESEFRLKAFPEVVCMARRGAEATGESSCGSGLPPPLSAGGP